VPYVAEFPLSLECRLIHTLKIGLHTLFVGKIIDVKADESVLGEKDRPAIGKVVGPAFNMGKELQRE